MPAMHTTAYNIRRALESNAPALTAIAFNSKRLWGYADAQMETWRADLRIDAAMIAEHTAYLLEHEGVIAGFYLLVRSDACWSLDHLWVLPEMGRRGYGSALLAHASATARDAGASAIHIDADPNAEAFYLHCGAQRVGVVAAPITGDPGRMRLQLILPLPAA
ncbi:MAG: GNAT family N-acetyltransferase [Betaproteobacteria bacterium]